LTELQLFSIYI